MYDRPLHPTDGSGADAAATASRIEAIVDRAAAVPVVTAPIADAFDRRQ